MCVLLFWNTRNHRKEHVLIGNKLNKLNLKPGFQFPTQPKGQLLGLSWASNLAMRNEKPGLKPFQLDVRGYSCIQHFGAWYLGTWFGDYCSEYLHHSLVLAARV